MTHWYKPDIACLIVIGVGCVMIAAILVLLLFL